jgi:hypothetical protein
VHVLIARFNYDLTEAELLATASEIAPAFFAIPGCFEKTWLIDPSASVAGGVYKFRDASSVRDYLASELWAGVKSNPHFSNLTTSVFGVMEAASEVTHGLPVARVS